MTWQQFIDMAVQEATRGLEGPAPSDVEVTAESLAPVVFDAVQRFCCAEPRRRTLLKKAKTLTLADGAATLSADVLTEYMDESKLYDPANPVNEYSFVPEWGEFTGQCLDARLGHFALQDASTLAQVEAGSQYAEGSGLSGEMRLDVPCGIQVPASDSATLEVRDEVAALLLREMAAQLRGEVEKKRKG